MHGMAAYSDTTEMISCTIWNNIVMDYRNQQVLVQSPRHRHNNIIGNSKFPTSKGIHFDCSGQILDIHSVKAHSKEAEMREGG